MGAKTNIEKAYYLPECPYLLLGDDGDLESTRQMHDERKTMTRRRK
jgi:hypothetical protein